tara:strand:+ start:699 stop:857 length:159 start_codon:yes stop_codon:yes gene_type:complete
MNELNYIIEDLKDATDRKDWDTVEQCIRHLEKVEVEYDSTVNREFYPNDEEY